MRSRRVVVVLLGLLLIAGIAFGIWRYHTQQLILHDLQDIPVEFGSGRQPTDLVPISGTVVSVKGDLVTIQTQQMETSGGERFVNTAQRAALMNTDTDVVILQTGSGTLTSTIADASVIAPGDKVSVYISLSEQIPAPTAWRIEIIR